MGSPAPISQMVKLRLDEGEGLDPDLSAQKWPRGGLKLSRLSRGQKPPHFGVPSLLKASASLGERGGLEGVTPKIVSRYDLCWSQVLTGNPPGPCHRDTSGAGFRCLPLLLGIMIQTQPGLFPSGLSQGQGRGSWLSFPLPQGLFLC